MFIIILSICLMNTVMYTVTQTNICIKQNQHKTSALISKLLSVNEIICFSFKKKYNFRYHFNEMKRNKTI